MTETESQKKRIHAFMLDGHAITQRIASREFNCDRLGARIWELRHEDGVPVQSAFEYKLDENGRVIKKWKKYWIGGHAGLKKTARGSTI